MNESEKYIKEIARLRKSEVLVLVTNLSPLVGGANIEHAMLAMVGDHLDVLSQKYELKVIPKLTMVLSTNGGNLPTARAIVKLIRQYCEQFEVIVFDRAMSAGTLLAVGADRIVMSKKAVLGPVDPSISQLRSMQAEVPVSVQDFLKSVDTSILTSKEKKERLLVLFSQSNPIVLGQALRAQSQIEKMLDEELKGRMTDEELQHTKTILMGYSVMHDYMIFRDQAKDELKLPVETMDSELESWVIRLFDCYKQSLTPPNPTEVQVKLKEKEIFEKVILLYVIEGSSSGQDVKVLKLASNGLGGLSQVETFEKNRNSKSFISRLFR